MTVCEKTEEGTRSKKGGLSFLKSGTCSPTPHRSGQGALGLDMRVSVSAEMQSQYPQIHISATSIY